MAHHSRLAGFIIDCRTGDLGAAAAFWSAALGIAIADADEGGEDRYARLAAGPGDLHQIAADIAQCASCRRQCRDHLAELPAREGHVCCFDGDVRA